MTGRMGVEYTRICNMSLNDGFDRIVKFLILESEVDLNIRWQDGKFLRSGVRLLDEELVNKTLHWLNKKRYDTVLQPFSKGLDHFLHSQKRPELLADVITDMYEALEALAKIITSRKDKDLSANRELFIKCLDAPEAYKLILKDYIDYANYFRHAIKEGEKRPSLSQRIVESFIYLTGIFIRLATAE